ncbi:MAG: hypothetical protein U0531_10160 [Dehalococcoidia bacterium]
MAAQDFFALQDALGADVIDYGEVGRHLLTRIVRRVAGMPAAQAALGCVRAGRYDRVLTDGEHIGIPLALLLSLRRRAPRHVTIGHLLTTPTKRAVFGLLRPQRRLDAVIVHAETQRQEASDRLGIAANRLALLPYQVDTDSWSPRAA